MSNMMRGDTIDGLSEAELNDTHDYSLQLHTFYTNNGVYKMSKSEADIFYKRHDAEIENLIEKEHNYIGSPLYGSRSLRIQAIAAGYRVLEIYPIFYQGWEMDEWGAIGSKDGKRWVLETSHGSLMIPTEPIQSVVRSFLQVLGFK